MKILAVVPARGGSRGIPRKNIRLLCGRPLLAWTADVARAAKTLDRVVLTTDDTEIAEVGRGAGLEVPFLRPAELARDDTPGVAPVLHALDWLAAHEGYRPDAVMLLQPPSPLRRAEHIEEAVALFERTGADCVVSICQPDYHPYWMKVIRDGVLAPFMREGARYNARQELPPVYRTNGAIYLARADRVLERRTFELERTVPYVMRREDSVNIDDEFDWWIAEQRLRERVGS
ncbi:MAG: cytidylyltransferase domain-containing protein [Candidatus Binatia bacterium]